MDLFARKVVRAAEPDLRRRLGIDRLDSDLVGDLYERVRELLSRSRSEAASARTRWELVDELAMTFYLVVATRQPGSQATPELLLALRRAVSAGLEDWKPSLHPDESER